MQCLINYQISDSLAGSLGVIVEPFLKMAVDRLVLSVAAILKSSRKIAFYKKKSLKDLHFCVLIFRQPHKLAG